MASLPGSRAVRRSRAAPAPGIRHLRGDRDSVGPLSRAAGERETGTAAAPLGQGRRAPSWAGVGSWAMGRLGLVRAFGPKSALRALAVGCMLLQ